MNGTNIFGTFLLSSLLFVEQISQNVCSSNGLENNETKATIFVQRYNERAMDINYNTEIAK